MVDEQLSTCVSFEGGIQFGHEMNPGLVCEMSDKKSQCVNKTRVPDSRPPQVANDVSELFHRLLTCPKQGGHIIVQVQEAARPQVFPDDLCAEGDVVYALENVVVQRGCDSSSFVPTLIGNPFIDGAKGIVLRFDGHSGFIQPPPMDKPLSRENYGRYESCHTDEPQSDICLGQENA